MYRIDQEKLIRSFSRSILSGSIEFTLSTRNLKGRLAGSGVSLTILGNYRCIESIKRNSYVVSADRFCRDRSSSLSPRGT